MEFKSPEFRNTRTQDLESTFYDAGQFYMSFTESYLREGNFIGQKSKGVLLQDNDAIDIDTADDWSRAEVLYKQRKKMKNPNWSIRVNPDYGYREVYPKPDVKSLADYYSQKYYQDEKATYTQTYSTEQLGYLKNKITQKDNCLSSLLNKKNAPRTLLDVGCGEGHLLNYFHDLEWNVLGIDHSDFAINKYHSHLENQHIAGDTFKVLNRLIEKKQKFSVINIDNVLEHVIDPKRLLMDCARLMHEHSILIIDVPNDYSHFQNFLVKNKMAPDDYWLAYPDHLNYFNYESLQNLTNDCGYMSESLQSDFPIEIFLSNTHSNYKSDSANGKFAHQSRMALEDYFTNCVDHTKLVAYLEAQAKIGFGRQIIGYFKRSSQ